MTDISHVLRLVNEQVALNAAAERKFPPATRFALDVAKTGACGGPPPREMWVRTAQMLGEREEGTGGAAASDALLDLAWVLEHGDPETCAAALGEVCRAQNPFRPTREGDPLDVLVPQLEDAPAARALDRAARLKLPPLGLLRRAGEIEDPLPGRIGRLGSPPTTPYSRSLALGLLGVAKQEVKVTNSLLSKYEDAGELFHKEDIEELGSSIARAYERIEHLRVNVDAGMLQYTTEYSGELAFDVAGFKERTERQLGEAEGDVESARRDLERVLEYAVAAPREDRNLRLVVRARDRARAVYDDFARMYDSAKAVDRATEYVIAYKNLADELDTAEVNAEGSYKDCVGRDDPAFGTRQDACGLARTYADEVERLRGLFPDFYSEDERRLPWRDELP